MLPSCEKLLLFAGGISCAAALMMPANPTTQPATTDAWTVGLADTSPWMVCVVCGLGRDPVCSVAGYTYRNYCYAQCVGAAVECMGPCPCPNTPCHHCKRATWEPVCSRTNSTYMNRCYAACHKDHAACEGECPCPDFPLGDLSELAAQSPGGDCGLCPVLDHQVCDCQGFSFRNRCFADCNGAVIECFGSCPCEASRCKPCDGSRFQPVCGVNGKTYLNECFAVCHSVASIHEGECGDSPAAAVGWTWLPLPQTFTPFPYRFPTIIKDEPKVPFYESGFLKDACMDYKLELLLLQDLSFTMDSALPDLFHELPQVLEELTVSLPGSRFGLASFTDKPIEPFGWGPDTDHCFSLHVPLNEDPAVFLYALQHLLMVANNDWEEGQLDAMHHAAVASSRMGFSTAKVVNEVDTLRVLMLATDSGFHTADDDWQVKYGFLVPNNGDGVLECPTEGYITTSALKSALIRENMHPLFLVTNDVAHIYENLSKDLTRGVVVTIDTQPAMLMNVRLKDAIDRLGGCKERQALREAEWDRYFGESWRVNRKKDERGVIMP